MELNDGETTVKAMEYATIAAITATITPGAKVRENRRGLINAHSGTYFLLP